jgi:S-adenosylmethionine hydrolase/Zn-dependent protease
MDKRSITLITDFGTRDGYVGVMKGVIAGINPDASVIDISHEVAPQDISEAAIILRDSYRYFPRGTIHLVVVDPGVGGSRRPIAVETPDYTFIGPDNGVFTPIYESGEVVRVTEITNRDIFLPYVSSTFHGRDVFAPAAAALSKGLPVPMFGPDITDYVRMKVSAPQVIGDIMLGEAAHIDNFGNIITNIDRDTFYGFAGEGGFHIEVKGRRVSELKKTYAEGESGELLALIGSSDRIEIAINQGNAAEALGAVKGCRVEVRRGRARRLKYKVNLFLFIATVFTTIFAGALQQGVNPFVTPWRIYKGFPFSFTLLSILLIHELGHFFLSRRHNVHATLPYFIPAPSFIGTFGAVIAMKELPKNRIAIMDVGVAGPLAGFVVAVAAYAIGLYLPSGQSTLTLSPVGESILSKVLIRLIRGEVPEYASILIHPIGFAGWLGLFVTSLNLLPIGQLDGGHVSYALFGDRQRFLAGFTVFVLIFLGLFYWPGWLFWGLLTLLMGIRHPRPMDPYTPLDPKRKVLCFIALVVFIITFMPTPFAF